MENAVYVLHQGSYSDQQTVGIFSTKEKMDKYISNNRSLRYTDDYWYECMIIDEFEYSEPEYHNHITRFQFTYSLEKGLEINILKDRVTGEESNTVFEINNPVECKIYKDAHYSRTTYSGYIIEPSKYSEEKILKIIQDKVYQRLSERNMKLGDEEIL